MQLTSYDCRHAAYIKQRTANSVHQKTVIMQHISRTVKIAAHIKRLSSCSVHQKSVRDRTYSKHMSSYSYEIFIYISIIQTTVIVQRISNISHQWHKPFRCHHAAYSMRILQHMSSQFVTMHMDHHEGSCSTCTTATTSTHHIFKAVTGRGHSDKARQANA